MAPTRGKSYEQTYLSKNTNRSKAHYYANKDYYAKNGRKYRKLNKERVYAATAKRRANKLNATPAWYDHEKVVKISALRIWLNETFDMNLSIDHIVPLQGDDVCGLHCVSNLQLLDATENMKKGNKYPHTTTTHIFHAIDTLIDLIDQ